MKNNRSRDYYYYLWVLISQTRDAIMRAREKELRRYNISPVQASVLRALEVLGEEATPAELARQLYRQSHSISELLIRMEKKGLVRKNKDLARKNLVRVEATEKGREAYLQSTKRESIHRILSKLSVVECQQLMRQLKKIQHQALKNAVGGLGTPFA